MWKETAIKISIYGSFATGCLLLLGRPDWYPEFYQPKFMAVISFLSAWLVILPGKIFSRLPEDKKSELVNLQFAVAIAVLVNGLGALGLYFYAVDWQYDKLAHYSIPLIFTFSGSTFFSKIYGTAFPRSLAASILMVIACGFGWELLELISDTVLGTASLGYYGAYKLPDTILDVCFNILGASSGAWAAIQKYRYGRFERLEKELEKTRKG